MGVAVEILLLCTLELATNDNKRLAYFRFLRRHIRFLERGIPPMSIAFVAQTYLGKATEAI